MKDSKIEWTDHTFNPWIGCTKVSPGCANCYAEARDHRWGHDSWGPGKPRRRTSAANWKQPIAWNRHWNEEGMSPLGPKGYRRPRVFCASLADWLDDEVPIEWLADLMDLIRRTPNLDWLLLTKRTQAWGERIELVRVHRAKTAIDGTPPSPASTFLIDWCIGRPPANVWVGATVEDQQRADERIPELLRIPARVRFLSCEPLLGWVALRRKASSAGEIIHATLNGLLDEYSRPVERGIHWVICGGESGPRARPMHPAWARSLRDQCAAARVPFFFKQWGEHVSIPAPDARWADGSTVPAGLEPMRYERVGKKAAGRLLDGREHNEIPEVRHA